MMMGNFLEEYWLAFTLHWFSCLFIWLEIVVGLLCYWLGEMGRRSSQGHREERVLIEP